MAMRKGAWKQDNFLWFNGSYSVTLVQSDSGSKMCPNSLKEIRFIAYWFFKNKLQKVTILSVCYLNLESHLWLKEKKYFNSIVTFNTSQYYFRIVHARVKSTQFWIFNQLMHTHSLLILNLFVFSLQ